MQSIIKEPYFPGKPSTFPCRTKCVYGSRPVGRVAMARDSDKSRGCGTTVTVNWRNIYVCGVVSETLHIGDYQSTAFCRPTYKYFHHPSAS